MSNHASFPAGRPPRVLSSLAIVVVSVVLSACGPAEGFRLLDADETGIRFANTITISEEHDFLSDAFIYNGAGVAIGDVDGDGLPDIYFTGNMVSSRLYLNRGGMRFEDVTEAAGVGTDRWATGASMVDIDADGDLDIHVAVAGVAGSPPEGRKNLLFLNNGDLTFTEAAERFGIADSGYTTHAVFLDYDLDQDLDLFLLANFPGEFARAETGRSPFAGPISVDSGGYDQLYRNEGNGSFVNVSAEAGISRELGYGLGAVSADINRDGWPDLYVSNDIAPNDVLYVNNGDGTFTDRVADWLGHTSYAGMGIDIADFSNDGWLDILQTDMMPEDLPSRKRVSGATTQDALETLSRTGFSPQYNLNTLQLNRGPSPDGGMAFSEVGRQAGIAYTHWSWSALFADYDNDGRKDVFITNGYPKAVIDFDYQTNNRRATRLSDRNSGLRLMREMLDSLHGYELPNHIFRNEGGLSFRDRTADWGLDQPSLGYGAAYADLDNDGRLDLVVNNMNAPAAIYRNVGAGSGHYLQIRLEGEGANRRGIGAKVTISAGGVTQYIDHSPFRGYLSTVDDRLHFGLGETAQVERVEVIWADGRRQRLVGLPADTLLTLRQSEAERGGRAASPVDPAPRGSRSLFAPAEAVLGLAHADPVNGYLIDYSLQQLLPHLVSREGPPLAVGDADEDGRADLFIGAPAGHPARLLMQGPDGRFADAAGPAPGLEEIASDDWGAIFLDANGDGRQDLYVASGGYHHAPSSRLLQDRLYLGTGGGRFAKAEGALPEMLTSTAAVVAGDFSGDGRPDLFVGGRITPGSYPTPTASYLLRNEGGRFRDVTQEMLPVLRDPGGMLTDAVWIDFNGDDRLDLVTSGIWMEPRFYANDGERFREVTGSTGLGPMRGWWYALDAGDLDGDGDLDLVAGNLGLNHSYQTSAESRFGVYAGDFSGYGNTDLIFTQEVRGEEYPFYGLAAVGRSLDLLSARYPTYASFSEATMTEIFGERAVAGALHYQADTFASVWLRNEGGGRFTAIRLPPIAQIAPIRDLRVEDLDGDGALDVLMVGNLLDTEANTAPVDAGLGLLLRGDGRGGFTAVSPSLSGFRAPGDARTLALVPTGRGPVVVVGVSGDSLRAFYMDGND